MRENGYKKMIRYLFPLPKRGERNTHHYLTEVGFTCSRNHTNQTTCKNRLRFASNVPGLSNDRKDSRENSPLFVTPRPIQKREWGPGFVTPFRALVAVSAGYNNKRGAGVLVTRPAPEDAKGLSVGFPEQLLADKLFCNKAEWWQGGFNLCWDYCGRVTQNKGLAFDHFH